MKTASWISRLLNIELAALRVVLRGAARVQVRAYRLVTVKICNILQQICKGAWWPVFSLFFDAIRFVARNDELCMQQHTRTPSAALHQSARIFAVGR